MHINILNKTRQYHAAPAQLHLWPPIQCQHFGSI